MLLDKIKALYNRFSDNRADPQDVHTIDGWIQEAKRLLLIQSLKNNDAIKYVLEIFSSEVEKINDKLKNSYSKDFPDSERDRLLDKRDLAQKYLNLFSEVDERLEKIEEEVDKES